MRELRERMWDLLMDAMEEEGLNQSGLARRLEVSRQRVSYLKVGTASIDAMDRCAHALGFEWEVRLVKRSRPR